MTQEEHTQGNALVSDIRTSNEICHALMQSPHYKRMGAEGIYAVVEKARSIGVSPLDALNGGMYFVQGKVEMTSAMMNQLIRQCGHSVTKDKRSDDTICILHGKRADNGDTWVESFSIDEAKRAGIYRNQWLKYPRDMLFARALSRLARQLFPDVIKGCYVQGEIIEDRPSVVVEDEAPLDTITDAQYEQLEAALTDNDVLRENILLYLRDRWNIDQLQHMPTCIFETALRRALDAKEAQSQEKVS